MSLKIRMARGGALKRPFYHVVVAESSCPRDGRFVERLGYYNPMLNKDHAERVVINAERAKYWLSKGAQPSERVALFLAGIGLIDKPAIPVRPKKSAPKKKAQERLKAEEEKKKEAEAASDGAKVEEAL